MDYIKKIMVFALPYKRYAFLNITANIFYALFSTLAMVSIMPMISILFDETKNITNKPSFQSFSDYFSKDKISNYFDFFVSNKLDTEGPSATLSFMVVIIISLFLLKNLFNYLGLYFITYLRNGILKDLRNEIYKKTLSLPISFFSEKRKGDIIARISGDVNEVQTSFLSILQLIVKEPLTIVFAIVAMFLTSVKLTVFVFLFIPISGFIISAIGKKLKKHSENVQKEQGLFLSTLEETLSALKVIKGFNAEQRFTSKFKASTNRFFNFSNQLAHRQNLASPTSEFLGIVTIAILLWYGGSMVLIDKTLSGGAFIGFMGLAYQILTPAKAISKAMYSVKRGNAAAQRVLEVLETKSPLEDAPNAKVKQNFTKAITLENVSFKYDENLVLKNFSINIPKGKTIALVGQSGLVTQDSILFNDTIKNNILVGKEDANDTEVIEALKIANAWEFVKDLSQGIHTNIGDSGNKLSGGQKQRLSIARAVLKSPPIMVLDEATSALDTESERLVQIALENMMKNRTSIVIAHRLSTIQNADNIIVLNKGEIVEQGKHDELIHKNGVYKKLVDMQSFV